MGFVAGYPATAVPSLKEPDSGFDISNTQASIIVGLFCMGSIFGNILSGPLMNYFGRKRMLSMLPVSYIAGWALIASAVHIYMILAGRAITGFTAGIAVPVATVYISEIADPGVRGRLAAFVQLLGTLGIVLSYTAGDFLDWYQLALVSIACPIWMLLCVPFVPCSPRWLLMQGREQEARTAMSCFRGDDYDVNSEIMDIKGTLKFMKESNNSSTSIIRKPNRKPFLICCTIFMLNGISGAGVPNQHTKTIFLLSGSSIDPGTATILTGMAQLTGNICACMVLDRLGRKFLLQVSSAFMAITWVTMGIYSYLHEQNQSLVENVQFVPLLSMIVFMFFFALGYRPIPNVITGEILPTSIRDIGGGITTSVNFLFAYICVFTYLYLVDWINPSGTYMVYMFTSILCFLYPTFYLPETKGKTLEEIEQILMGDKLEKILSEKSEVDKIKIRFDNSGYKEQEIIMETKAELH